MYQYNFQTWVLGRINVIEFILIIDGVHPYNVMGRPLTLEEVDEVWERHHEDIKQWFNYQPRHTKDYVIFKAMIKVCKKAFEDMKDAKPVDI